MQVSVESVSTLERRVTISVPAAEVDVAFEKKLKDTASRARIDGFRPGKVPMKEVRRRYARSIREEILGDVINNSFYQAITKEKLNLAGNPHIEFTKDEPGQDVEYVATFEVYPEIQIKNLENIVVEKPVSEIADADIDAMLEKLRQQRAIFVKTEEPAADGDQITIDFSGSIDGVAFEGGAAEGHALVLGSKSMIPGFEDALIGASAGEDRTINVTFPEAYHSEELKGKAAQFAVKVHKVERKQLAEVDDEFIKHFGVTEGGVDAFRAEIRKNMERELKNAIKNKVKNQVFEGLLKHNELEVPKALVSQETDRMRKQMLQQFGGQGANLDISMLPAELFTERATHSVKLGLLLSEFMRTSELSVDAERVRKTIEELAEPFEQPQEVIDWYNSNDQQRRQLEAAVLEDQAVEKLLETAQVSEKVCSYEDAIKPIEPAAEEAEEETASEA
ncbi:FKBP-type peptidyl-prolyl cis-trans isomerase (trigger factor) [gamma proteobacterium HdN1]|nr:FKBP-type peptidyl-prolyl cis-trans isomerase (trigger factor) [gamma proteobacterium HdN1]